MGEGWLTWYLIGDRKMTGSMEGENNVRSESQVAFRSVEMLVDIQDVVDLPLSKWRVHFRKQEEGFEVRSRDRASDAVLRSC